MTAAAHGAITMLTSMTRRALLTLGGAALILAGGASPVAAGTTPTFDVALYSPCVSIKGTPTLLGSASQLNSAGAVLETAELSFDGSGVDSVCFDTPFMTGMKVRATDNGVTRTFTIPKLSFTADRATDVLAGVGPAGAKLSIQVNRASSVIYDQTSTSFTRTTSSTGRWSIDTTSTFNLIGGDSAQILYQSAAGDTATRFGVVPRVIVTIGRSSLQATINPNDGGSVVLRNSAGTFRGKAAFAGAWWSTESTMEGRFIDSTGSAVGVRIGDKVSAPFQSSFAFTVPKLTVAANADTDVVSGSCPAGKRMTVTIIGKDRSPLTCSSGGTYSIDLTVDVDVLPGDRVLVAARLSGGDLVQRGAAAQ